MNDKENTTIVDGAGRDVRYRARIAQIKAQIEETDLLITIARSSKSGWPNSQAASR